VGSEYVCNCGVGGFTSSAPQLQARGILERGNEGREGVFQCGLG
jgi:hypothetical protein